MQRAVGNFDWRSCLANEDDSWDELLGLPHTLREIAGFLEPSQLPTGTVQSIPTVPPRWISPSDLFLKCSRKMLLRELDPNKVGGKSRLRIAGDDRDLEDDCVPLLERALGAIAFEMACDGHWKEVIPPPSVRPGRFRDEIIDNAKQRFLKPCKEDKVQIDHLKAWQWSKALLDKFEFLNGATQADIGKKVISFSTRRVQEMRIVMYLSG